MHKVIPSVGVGRGYISALDKESQVGDQVRILSVVI